PQNTEPISAIPPPEECSPFQCFTDLHACVEVRRPVPPPTQTSYDGINLDVLWSRITVPVESVIDHICLLTFMSDLGGGFSNLNLPGSTAFGPSIDHAVWFHSTIRSDEWMLFDQRAVKVGGSRGLYIGAAHSEGGKLGAMFTQEVLLRPDRVARPDLSR
ncbi:MAG: tesB, partial [Acidimicrobiia bacterium]|nr:tesB [Acidimicrobiia bacterium]